MTKKDFRITIADVPNRDEPVCEVYYKEMGWVEISYDKEGLFSIVFFNKKSSNYWEFTYEEAIEVLKEAKDRLIKFQRTPEAQAECDAWREKYKDWKPTPKEQADYEAKMKAQHEKYYGKGSWKNPNG